MKSTDNKNNMIKINTDIVFQNGSLINFSVYVYEDDVKEFLLLNYLSPSKNIYDNYLAYVPELKDFSGEDIKRATLKSIIMVK